MLTCPQNIHSYAVCVKCSRLNIAVFMVRLHFIPTLYNYISVRKQNNSLLEPGIFSSNPKFYVTLVICNRVNPHLHCVVKVLHTVIRLLLGQHEMKWWFSSGVPLGFQSRKSLRQNHSTSCCCSIITVIDSWYCTTGLYMASCGSPIASTIT